MEATRTPTQIQMIVEWLVPCIMRALLQEWVCPFFSMPNTMAYQPIITQLSLNASQALSKNCSLLAYRLRN